MKKRGLWLTGLAALMIFLICAILLSTVFTQSKDAGDPIVATYVGRTPRRANIDRIRHIVLIADPESAAFQSLIGGTDGESGSTSPTTARTIRKSAHASTGNPIAGAAGVDPGTLPAVLGATGVSWQCYVLPQAVQNSRGLRQPESMAGDLATHFAPQSRFLADAHSGDLPSVSAVALASSRDGKSREMCVEQDIRAVMDGPDWASSVVFVAETDGASLRMLSAYRRSEDSEGEPGRTYSIADFLRFVEARFNLPLTGQQPDSGDILDAFDFGRAPALPTVLPNWRESRSNGK